MRLICFGENPGLAEARVLAPQYPQQVASYHDDQPDGSQTTTLEALAETRSTGSGDKREQQSPVLPAQIQVCRSSH